MCVRMPALGVLLVLLCHAPAMALGIGVGVGTIGTDYCASTQIRYWGVLDKMMGKRTMSVIAFGVSADQSGYLDDQGVEDAFVAGGLRFNIADSLLFDSTPGHVTGSIIAFPRKGDSDGLNLGLCAQLGIEKKSRLGKTQAPGGYFAEMGAIASQDFVTVWLQVGIFIGE